MEVSSIEELKLFCHSCLNTTKETVSVWDYVKVDEMQDEKQLAEMLMECTSVQIETSTESSEILCTDCLSLLLNAYNFKIRSLQSDKCLQNILVAFKEDLESKDLEISLPQTCDTCCETFPDKNLLDIHKNEYHNFRCTKCLQLFETKSDFSQHTCAKFECEECLEKFDTDVELQNHESEVHKDLKFNCSLCAEQFELKSLYLDHFHNHIASANYFDFKETDQGYSCFACPSKNIHDEKQLSLHLQDHSIHVCNVCKEVFLDLQNLRQHIAIHGMGSFICQHCLVSYQRKDQILIHLKTHPHLRHHSNYQCLICDQNYSSRVDLKCHIKTHVAELSTCALCKETFDTIDLLRKHKLESHSKGCLCPVCGKTFLDSQAVDSHVKYTHSNHRLYECDICHKMFRLRYTLSQHRRTHNSFKQFGCSTCSYRSHSKKDMTVHERTHSNEKPYKCTWEGCTQWFRTISQQKQHLRMHTGERQHECKICWKRFREASILTNHMLVHTGLKKHVCDICGKGFRHLCDVKNHRRNVHFKDRQLKKD